jgi:hypothetical protein
MKKYILAYLILILAIASRFVPHMANAAPITALAIFAAAYLPARRATFVVLLVRFVSDVFLGFFAWPLMVAVYAAHLFGILLGLWIKNSGEPQVGQDYSLWRIVIGGIFLCYQLRVFICSD